MRRIVPPAASMAPSSARAVDIAEKGSQPRRLETTSERKIGAFTGIVYVTTAAWWTAAPAISLPHPHPKHRAPRPRVLQRPFESVARQDLAHQCEADAIPPRLAREEGGEEA